MKAGATYAARRKVQKTLHTTSTHVNHAPRKTGAILARMAGISDDIISYLGSWNITRMHEHYLRVVPPGDVARLACKLFRGVLFNSLYYQITLWAPCKYLNTLK